MFFDETLQRMRLGPLNPMQRDTCDKILHTNSDVVVVAPTGSGKTLAYLLPLMQLIDTGADSLQALVVVPNRELALQSMQVMESMKTDARQMCCHGGRPAMDEHRQMRQVWPHVIFGTPGRLNDHLDKRNMPPYNIRYLVIDEFDKCLEMGFQAEMTQLLGRLPGLKRRILLSATDAIEIPSFVDMRHTAKVDYSQEKAEERITLYELHSPEADKLGTLRQLLCSLGDSSSMVFLNHRDSVERVAAYLRQEGFGVSAFHGGLDQAQREAALYRFANGSANILVTTDLASRGIDIAGVDTIIHYHMPPTHESYIHRIGRTARWEANGRSVLLLGPGEQTPSFAMQERQTWQLAKPLPGPMPPRMVTIYIGKGKKDKISKADIVGLLCKKGQLTGGDIGRIDVKERYAYVAVARQKHANLLKMLQGEKIKGQKTVFEIVK